MNVFRPGDLLRDYLFIDDAVRVFLNAGAKADQLGGRHFVVGSGQGRTLVDAFKTVADLVARKMGKTVPVNEVDPPQDLPSIDFRNFVANPKAFMQLTGWRPMVGFEEGIDLTINSFLDGT